MAKVQLDIDQIRALLPHRYPMLLIDRVLEIGEDSVVAEKFVSVNEPYFAGHFPEKPIMPGVLIVEAIAQTAGIGVRYHVERSRSMGLVLASIHKARFRKPVFPGTVLVLHVQQKRRRGDVILAEGIARVEGEVVAEAEIMAALVPWEEAK